jgi:hypothetical protein
VIIPRPGGTFDAPAGDDLVDLVGAHVEPNDEVLSGHPITRRLSIEADI